MRNVAANRSMDPRFDLPPQFAVGERRMAGQAIDLWRDADKRMVSGFDADSLVITDSTGMATIETIGCAVAATFGLEAGMRIDGREGLAAELRAACALIALDLQPVPFESNFAGPAGALILARGVALPIASTGIEPESGAMPDRVQVIINWRQLLDRAATTRLRRELGHALRIVAPNLPISDPFARAIAG